MTVNVPVNFELYIRRSLADGSFAVTARVLATDQLVEGSLALPDDEAATTAFLDAVQEGAADLAAMQAFGGRLFDALFTGRIRDLYAAVRARQDQAFRYRLILDDPAVASLPWELLYDRERQAFLALENPIVRSFGLAEPAQPLETQPPLRILVAAAFPQNLPGIQGEEEVEVILHELAELVRRKDAEVVPLMHVTLRALQNALREAMTKGQPFHILHVISHGALDRSSGRARLFLEDEQGQPQPVEPLELANVLRPYNLKLVYLNGCETVALAGLDLAQGFAPALLAAGTPAVIGMQVPVWDQIARQTAQDFYAALADNQAVDQALLNARQLAHSGPLPASGIAIPVCYLRTASGQIVDLVRPEAPRLSRATWRAWVKVEATPKRLAQGLIALIGLLSALLGIYVGLNDLRAAAGPTPVPPMSGAYNIAVAALSEIDPQGRSAQSKQGQELAEEVYAQIVVEAQTLQDAGFNIGVYGPAETGFVTGSSDEERSENATVLAQRLNVDLLLYGHLMLGQDSTSLVPHLFVSSNHLAEASELTGEFQFGDPIQVPDNVENNVPALKELREDLAQRTSSLAKFVVGLGYYKLNQLFEAARWLEDARRSSDDDAKILPVIYLFLGSTAARQGDTQEGNLYYGEALRQDPLYARARLGQAQMAFQQARRDCTAQTIDKPGLERAIAGYQEARDLTHTDAEEIPSKVAFYLGQVYLCQALAGDIERWDMAQGQLERVVNRYETDNDVRVKQLAAEAWFHLGMLHAKKSEMLGESGSELGLAVEALRQAIALSGLDDRRATFGYWLARTHGRQAQCAQARQGLADADADLQRFVSRNPAFDTHAIQVFQNEVLLELQRLCPMPAK